MHVAEQSATNGGGARATGPLIRTVAIGFAIALVLGAAVGRFVFITPQSASPSVLPAVRGGDLDAARAALAADPNDAVLLSRVGTAALAEARRTADPSYYSQAATAIDRALVLAPDDLRPLVTSGLLALARHDFSGALALAERARAAAPEAVDPLAVQIDALVELGRYDEASVVAQAMVSLRPNASSLPRLSYVLELTGDPTGALETMQQAVAAAGARGPDAGYVLALLGDLHLQAGRLDAAGVSYERALRAQPAQPQAELGLARVAIDRGDLSGASSRLAALIDRLPLPDAIALYADVVAAAGDEANAAKQRQLVRAIEELNRTTGGIAVDLELARFEAAHARLPGGDAARAVSLAESARAARPTIYGDDILGWALRQAGRPADALPHTVAATRLGTADATLWFHRATIEADLGMMAEARIHLDRSRDISPFVALADRVEAEELARRLGQ